MEKKIIQFLLHEGTLEGILTANNSNGIATVVSSPIEKIEDFYKLSEANKAGVYFCLGKKENEVYIYVGQGQEIKKRLQFHSNEKDWWPEIFKIISINSKDESLDLADINYLEHRFIEIAYEAELKSYNGTEGNKKKEYLDDIKKTTLDKFIDEVLLLFDIMNIKYFQKNKSTGRKKNSINAGESAKDTSHRKWNSRIARVTFYLERESERKDCFGKLEWRKPDEIVLLRGTELCPKELCQENEYGEKIEARKKKLRNDGYIQKDKLCKNVHFDKIQDATHIVYGGNADVWEVWETEKGEKLDDVCKRFWKN